MECFDDIATRIHSVVAQLDALEKLTSEYAEKLGKTVNSDLTSLCVQLETRLHALTHETASVIGFACNDCENLVHFIQFRDKTSEFCDNRLRQIIDSPTVPLSVKQELRPLFTDAKSMLDRLHNIRTSWEKLFPGKTYASVSDHFLSN